MKNNSRIVIISILLVFLLTFLIGATYAWFSQNEEVTATDISLRVRTVQYLEVSTDAKSWYQQITLQEVVNADYDVDRHNQTPTAFQPVSTTGSITDGNLNMFVGNSVLDSTNTSPTYGSWVMTTKRTIDGDGDVGHYLVFDMYIKNTFSKVLYLGHDSYVGVKTGSDPGIANTLRLGFVYEGTTSSESTSTIQSLKTSNANNVVIWEPNYNKHTNAAIEIARSRYGKTLTNDMANYVSYLGVKDEITTPVPITSTDSNYFGEVNHIVRTDSEFRDSDSDNLYLFDLPAGYSKIRIYAWIEGQDVDCINDLNGSNFIFNLNFATSKNSQEVNS